MKAIRVHEFDEPEVMRLEEIADPQAESGQVVVRLHAVGVNPVDTYIRAGLANKTLHPVVGQEMPLADAARAHRAVLEAGAHGKIVLIP